MKALLLKDWYVLRKQAWAYLIIVLVWGAIPSEVLNLLAVVYGAMIPYTAMAYDQRSRWDRFARIVFPERFSAMSSEHSPTRRRNTVPGHAFTKSPPGSKRMSGTR